ncbi:MAG TPA: integrase arm-type DNA-binding domain-containing protein [Vicinamibacterales bacterium]|nr:integrase arm-type DNA-binding domain-containing protein [Vicinamibacterales bacterium]
MPEAVPFPRPAARLERRRIINDTTVRSIKPPTAGSLDYFDDLTAGLSLRVTANDVRTWTVFYRDQNGRQKRLKLGRYPAVKLVDARELARDAQRKVAHGGDPVVEKRAAREVLTFGELAKDYIDNHAKPNKRSWQEDERQLNASLLPKWKTRPASDISTEDLLAVLNAKLRNGAPVAANRLRALVSRVFTFGAEQRLVVATANPVIGVKKPTKETTRDRVLTDSEIRRLWEACATQNAYVCAWFRLRLVTAQRGGELLQMRWQDIDPKSHFWTIPGEFVKNAHGHRVFLNETARKILAGVPKLKKPKKAMWVFPKSLMGDYKHVGRRLAQSTRANIVVEPKTNGKARDRVDIRGHDLRRTAASLMASGGVPRFVISRILNHSEEKDITSVYDRYSYDAEKRAAMEFWNRQLAAVLKGKSALSVRRFASALAQ